MNRENKNHSGGMGPAPVAERKYTVFISYRHADNKEPGRQWANWLHQTLETYEVPADLVGEQNQRGEPVPASFYPVFQDEEELPADADLSGNLRRALKNSSHLVVICSPRATGSRFVADEIHYFKELGRGDRILALIIDGEPNVADNAVKQEAGLSPELECFPHPLRYGVSISDGGVDWTTPTEPIAADARPGGRPEQGYTNRMALRDALISKKTPSAQAKINVQVQEYERRLELARLKIIAGVLGVPLGELTRRDKARQLEQARHRTKILRRWLCALLIMTLASLVAGGVAWTQKREADLQRDLAIQRAVEIENHNTAEKMARRAWFELLDNKPQKALVSVQEALRLNPALSWARPSLAHAHLLLGHYAEAEQIYLTNQDLHFELNGRATTFTDQVFNDFSKLCHGPVTNADMQKIEAMLKPKKNPG